MCCFFRWKNGNLFSTDQRQLCFVEELMLCLHYKLSLGEWAKGFEASLGVTKMVKKLEFRGVIEFARPETVFKYLYEDDAFIKLYHKEVNDDPNASATSWTSEEDGGRRREVTFKPRLASVPVLFRRYLGGDIAQLTEVQHCTGDGNTFTIRSELSTAVFGGLTLVTHGDTILSPAEKGCAIAVELTLELQTGLWWGLEGRVEAYAEEEARAVFRRWLNIARVFCEDKMGLEKEPLLKEEDSFHDVEDLGQQDSEEISTAAELNIDPITGLPNSPSFIHFASGSQDWFVQELWRNFRMAMRINHAKLQKVEREILLLRRSSWFFLKAWTVFGLGIATGLCLGFLYNRKLKRCR